MTKIPEISIESNSYDRYGSMAFSANWRDATHRFHVWLGLRPPVDGTAPAYPVAIEPTIYKNTIDGRANTIRMSLDAKAHAAVKAAIRKAATAETLHALADGLAAYRKADDDMRREAYRIDAIHDACATLARASLDDLAAYSLEKSVNYAGRLFEFHHAAKGGRS